MMATKGKVSSVPKQVLDMRTLGHEQAMRVGETFVVAKLLESLAGLVYAYGSGSEPTADVEHQGWTLSWRREPTPRVQVRTFDPKLQGLVREALQALTYEVRDKDDHLVVIL